MTEHPEEAESAIQLALSLSPGAIAPLTYRIHEALYNGDTQRAWQLLDQIVEKNEPDYIYDRGEILIVEGRIQEADDYFREEFKKVPAEEYQDFVVDVANIYSDYGQSDKAMEWMNRARYEDTPEFKEIMARTLFGLGKYKDSEKLFNELIDTDPFQKRYWNALASVQFMNEDYSNAIQSSEYAIAIDPKDPEGLIAKANGLYRLNNFEEARKYYQRYREQVPDDEFAILHEGTCLINMGLTDDAIELLEHGADIAQKNGASNMAELSRYLPDIYQELAFVYSEKKMLEKALHYIDLTKTLDCDHAEIEVIRGHVLLANGHVEEAEETFRDAVLKAEDKEKIMLRMLVSLYDNGYVSAAYFMFQKYFEMVGPECYVGYAYIALCCWDLHKANEFIKYLETAVERNPREAKIVLSHLFPEDMQPADYVEYARNRINKTS
jgi:tetratricopeptide (TPR) repeat protein